MAIFLLDRELVISFEKRQSLILKCSSTISK